MKRFEHRMSKELKLERTSQFVAYYKLTESIFFVFDFWAISIVIRESNFMRNPI